MGLVIVRSRRQLIVMVEKRGLGFIRGGRGKLLRQEVASKPLWEGTCILDFGSKSRSIDCTL